LPLKPSYLALTGAGAIVAYAGFKGWGIGKTIRDVISGQNPATNPTLTAQITPGIVSAYGYGAPATGGGSGGATAHGSVAGIAESLIGFPYVWGGAPASGASDCSGFVNWVVGVKAGLAIPGYKAGTYNGSSHGPNTVIWLAWIGTGLTRVAQAQAQAGDLAIWQTHMGIITDNGVNMVSDLNPGLGTRATSIAGGGPSGEILVCARLR
jgi:cell wall-associated NlpC family hydrolase